MRVRATWLSRTRKWRLWDVQARKAVGYADRVLLRSVEFSPSGNITGDLEAVSSDCGTSCGDAVRWYEWHLAPRSNGAYGAAAAKYGQAVSFGDAGFSISRAEMVFLGHTRGAVAKRKPGILAFDPCQMTSEESRRATQ